jgi:hypothetical protein
MSMFQPLDPKERTTNDHSLDRKKYLLTDTNKKKI